MPKELKTGINDKFSFFISSRSGWKRSCENFLIIFAKILEKFVNEYAIKDVLGGIGASLSQNMVEFLISGENTSRT